jgi:DNA-binding MarR family transcriptional regulator
MVPLMADRSERARRANSAGHSLWLDDYLPYRAAVAASEIGKVISPFYQRFGLSMPEIAVISVLHEEPELTQQMIVSRTVMEKFTVSRAVRSLNKRGLTRRKEHETDGRSARVSLTPAGRRLFARVVPMSLAYEERLKRALGGEEQVRAAKQMLLQLQDAAKSLAEESEHLFSPYAPTSKASPTG